MRNCEHCKEKVQNMLKMHDGLSPKAKAGMVLQELGEDKDDFCLDMTCLPEQRLRRIINSKNNAKNRKQIQGLHAL